MDIDKIISVALIVAAAGALLWSVMSFINTDTGDKVLGSAEYFKAAVSAELPDKCQTPDGYTDEEWAEHMSHHPDRYAECFVGDSLSVKANKLYQNIEPEDLSVMLKAKDFTLIDVHVPEQEHIAGTDLVLPYNELADRISELPTDKNAKIVLYCRSGNMSEQAAETLLAMGYTNVYNLAGGANAWQQAGYSLGGE
jgi:rhodanese-related sulfurtransferase